MRTIQASEETHESIKDQLNENERFDASDLNDFVGKKVLIRTFTHYHVGKVEKIVGGMFELSDSSWIPDTGPFSEALKGGSFDEVQPVGQAWVAISGICDMFPWKHDLPTQ